MNQAAALTPAAFQALVLEELVIVDRFVDVLQREQQALVDGKTDDLSALATDKTDCCNQLDRIGRQRQLMLSTAGLAPVPASLTPWLNTQPQALRDTWEALLTKANEARNLNRQNGELISTRVQHNRQALTVLLEISNRAAVYGPDGQPRPGSGGRILGKG